MFKAVFVKVALLISLVFVSTIQAEENPLIRAGGELIGELGVSGAPGGRDYTQHPALSHPLGQLPVN